MHLFSFIPSFIKYLCDHESDNKINRWTREIVQASCKY